VSGIDADIFQLVDFLKQCPFEFFELHPVYAAFKDRLLNSLANGLAGLATRRKRLRPWVIGRTS